jgi:cysteine-S-conjugate beta-lyase
MKYEFDEPENRRGTNCVKYDAADSFFGTADLIPMWVADMDFKSPPSVREAIMNRAMSGIYGYSIKPAGYFDSLIEWMKERHGLHIEKEWIVATPGIVPALNMAVLAYTKPGDRVLVQPPVYFPFFSAIQDHERQIAENPLKWTGEGYAINFKHLEAVLSSGVKLMLFCSPHNPVGRVWTRRELEEVAALCNKYGTVLLSDEIHCDLAYPPAKHIPMAATSKEALKNTITCLAPSKTFNLAGLSTSSVIIQDSGLREQFRRIQDSLHIASGNIFGTIASEAAYRHGSEWLDQLMEYLQGNLEYLTSYIHDHMPMIQVVIPEATYLVWIDFSRLGFSQVELKQWLITKARIGMNDGAMFGKGGEGFMRMNIACSRSVLKQALEQLDNAVKSLS